MRASEVNFKKAKILKMCKYQSLSFLRSVGSGTPNKWRDISSKKKKNLSFLLIVIQQHVPLRVSLPGVGEHMIRIIMEDPRSQLLNTGVQLVQNIHCLLWWIQDPSCSTLGYNWCKTFIVSCGGSRIQAAQHWGSNADDSRSVCFIRTGLKYKILLHILLHSDNAM